MVFTGPNTGLITQQGLTALSTWSQTYYGAATLSHLDDREEQYGFTTSVLLTANIQCTVK
uniref:Uncharacterized protein n=1 Tax=Anguilla anguilla TaxID=7936 RepID=A0A0E9R009_ANGAN